MQEKEPITFVQCELKFLSLGITVVWHHSASLVIPNNYPHDGISNPHLTTIKSSYILLLFVYQKGQCIMGFTLSH